MPDLRLRDAVALPGGEMRHWTDFNLNAEVYSVRVGQWEERYYVLAPLLSRARSAVAVKSQISRRLVEMLHRVTLFDRLVREDRDF